MSRGCRHILEAAQPNPSVPQADPCLVRGSANETPASSARQASSQPRPQPHKRGRESLTICMLHETPASVSRIARLSCAYLAEEGTKGKTYAILGENAASCAPDKSHIDETSRHQRCLISMRRSCLTLVRESCLT